MVGQKISLSGLTQPCGLTVSSRSWTLPGTLVKSYSQAEATAGTAALSNADLSGGTVGYYWIAGGTENVSYTATFGVVSLSASTTFNVQRPAAMLLCLTTTNSPAVNCDDPGFNGGLELHFGSRASPGISWTGTVTTPLCGSGSIACTQLINEYRHQTLAAGGKTQTVSSSGAYVLDNKLGIQYDGSAAIGDSDTQASSKSDTPGSRLAGTIQKSASDSFQLYLMYHPSGADSIRVTLREVDWNWSGKCTLNGTWSMDAPGNASVDPPSSDSTTLPTWSNYSTNLRRKDD